MKIINDLKAGMYDAVVMVKDKNLKPFARPFFVLMVVIIIAWFLHKGTSAQIADMKRKAEAQAAEVENREDYLKNKSRYFRLAEALPPNTEKSRWHASEIISIKESIGLSDKDLTNANETQTTEGVFTISTIPLKGELTFEQIGRLLEAMENSPVFMRVSNLRISRKPGELEKLSVTLNSNTVFIQDRDFPKLIGGKNEK